MFNLMTKKELFLNIETYFVKLASLKLISGLSDRSTERRSGRGSRTGKTFTVALYSYNSYFVNSCCWIGEAVIEEQVLGQSMTLDDV